MQNVIPLKRLDARTLGGSANCGMRNAECGMCSVRGARCKVQTKCGMTNAECGIPDFGFEPPQRAEISAMYVRTCVLSNRLGFEFRAGLRPLTYMARRATKEGEFFPASIAGGTHDHDCLGRCWARQCITATAAPPTPAADESADFSKSWGTLPLSSPCGISPVMGVNYINFWQRAWGAWGEGPRGSRGAKSTGLRA
jgi:hypothetical protein